MIKTSSILLVSFLTFLNCKVVDDNQNSNTKTVKTFQITDGEIQGWTFQSGWEWQSFNAINMNGLVDGDADYFTKGGLASGAAQRIQNLKTDPVERNEIWIMDFTTNETAAKMFQTYVKSEKFSTPKQVTASLPISTAAMDDSKVDGCTTIAHFDQFVIVIFLTAYNEKANAITDAAQLIEVFKSKQL